VWVGIVQGVDAVLRSNREWFTGAPVDLEGTSGGASEQVGGELESIVESMPLHT